MSISIEEFKQLEDVGRFRGKVPQFFRRNPGRAWNRQEISSGTGIPVEAIDSILSRLKRKGFVVAKNGYYAWKPIVNGTISLEASQ